MSSFLSFSLVVHLFLTAYVGWLIWKAREAIDHYSLLWLLLIVCLSGLLSTQISLENWPVGPAVWAISGWCWFRLAAIWIKMEKPRGRDWGPIFGGASAGMTLLAFILIGYDHNEVLSSGTMICAQISSSLIFAILLELFSSRIDYNYRDIIFVRQPQQLKITKMIFSLVF